MVVSIAQAPTLRETQRWLVPFRFYEADGEGEEFPRRVLLKWIEFQTRAKRQVIRANDGIRAGDEPGLDLNQRPFGYEGKISPIVEQRHPINPNKATTMELLQLVCDGPFRQQFTDIRRTSPRTFTPSKQRRNDRTACQQMGAPNRLDLRVASHIS